MRYSSDVRLIKQKSITESAFAELNDCNKLSETSVLAEFLDLGGSNILCILVRFIADIQHSPGRDEAGYGLDYSSRGWCEGNGAE